ncbi:hypothetical protein ILYODFUR_036540 [Ilyodon furcidens]|uniref:Uncharacterized protein n=1 Tax=Ilyodon furcidens TaxID=33524 RepID=A0ABV0V002_9TELE
MKKLLMMMESLEIFTHFWEQFPGHCEGEDERVPRLRADFTDSEWQAVGRIWVKVLLDHCVWLCKAFILACIHGTHYVDQDILMSSFLKYLPFLFTSTSACSDAFILCSLLALFYS